MKAYILIVAAMLLSGCAATKTKPDIIEVDHPVATNCIKEMPRRPDYQTEKLGTSATDLQYADALSNDWPLSRAYEKKMEDAVRACLVN